MAGNTLQKNRKPLKVAESTPHDTRDGVVAKVQFAALAKYEINVRSFHPNKNFEKGGFRFHGDNRAFSLGDSFFGKQAANSVSSRIWQRYVLDMNLNAAGNLDENQNAKLKQESNTSDSGPGSFWGIFGDEEKYEQKNYKPRGKLTAILANAPHGGQKEVEFRSWYGGENHAFLFSRTVHDWTGKTFVPTLDVFSDVFIRVERVHGYMDIVSLTYGDGFPNCESFIKDAAGNKLFLGTHVRIGVPATHLAGENNRLMWANAIRIEIDREGNFGEKLWKFAQVLGGPPDLRDEYPTNKNIEVCRIGAKTDYYSNPFNDRPPRFIWNCGKLENISQSDQNRPLHLSAFTAIEQVRSKVQESWMVGPIEKTTRTNWNNHHLHRNPNEGRPKDYYDVPDDKWKQAN